MVDDFEDFKAGVRKTSPSFPVFPSEHAYVDWVSRGIQWFAFYWACEEASDWVVGRKKANKTTKKQTS